MMWLRTLVCIFFSVLCVEYSLCKLWTKGVVHYSINAKDYDFHSQELIVSTMARMETELCVKFFKAGQDFEATLNDKLLFITNPKKLKTCLVQQYDYSKSVVEMAIGYKCLEEKEISRMLMEMLNASINPIDVKPVNSDEFMKMIADKPSASNGSLIPLAQRSYINAHYQSECRSLDRPEAGSERRADKLPISDFDNKAWYTNKLWPLGVVMYGVSKSRGNSKCHERLRMAMSHIEASSCVVFQYLPKESDEVAFNNFLWFSDDGLEEPHLGIKEGNQTINIDKFCDGDRGHKSHLLNNLMRVLGVPMMSNRYDRDRKIKVYWNHVIKGKEQYLERLPYESMPPARFQYDFTSVTHAPCNYQCTACRLTDKTVRPARRSGEYSHLLKTMGRYEELSKGDRDFLSLLYADNCKNRTIYRH